MDGLIGEERLMEVTGCKQRGALSRHLRKAGIPFKVVNGHILSTEAAITAALVGRTNAKKKGPNFDAVR